MSMNKTLLDVDNKKQPAINQKRYDNQPPVKPQLSLSLSQKMAISTEVIIAYSMKHPTLSCTEVGVKFHLSRQAIRERYNSVSYDPKHFILRKDQRANKKALEQQHITENVDKFLTSTHAKINDWDECHKAIRSRHTSEESERADRGQETIQPEQLTFRVIQHTDNSQHITINQLPKDTKEPVINLKPVDKSNHDNTNKSSDCKGKT